MKIVLCFFLFLRFSFAQTADQAAAQDLNRARQYEREGNWLQAAAIYKTVIDHFPEDRSALHHGIDLCSKAGRFDWALELIERKKNLITPDIDLEVLEAQIVYRSGKEDEAFSLWEAVLNKHQDDEWVVILVANTMIEEKRIDRAIQTYLGARKRGARPEMFSLNLALAYEAGEEYDNAAREWMSYTRSHRNQIGTVESHLIQFPLDLNTVRKIDRIIKKETENQPENTDLIQLLCRYQLRFRLFPDALETSNVMDRQAPESRRGEALFQFAQQVLIAGETRLSESAYMKIIETYPGFSRMDQVLFHLAQSRAGMGLFKEAVQGLESLILSHPESGFAAQALLEKGKMERDRLGEPDKAVATFSHLISRYPLTRQHDEGFMELGDCHLLNNDITLAKKTYEQLGRMAFSKNRIAFMRSVIRLAEIDFFIGHFESSMSHLDSLFQNWLEPEEAQDALVNDALSLNLMMKTYIQIDRGALSVLASGLLLSRQRQWSRAEVLFDKLISSKKKDDPFFAEALFQKGELLFSAERFDESLSCYKKLLAVSPVSNHSERAMERMGRLLEKAERIKEAVQTYERFLELYPRSSYSGEIRKHLQDMEATRP